MICNHQKGNGGSSDKPWQSRKGFTLLEILVTLIILGVAIITIVQLFSSNIKSITKSEELTKVLLCAESKMRQIQCMDKLDEKSWSEITEDGYKIDIIVSETLNERTQNLPLKILAIALTVYRPDGRKNKSITLRTLKIVDRMESESLQQGTAGKVNVSVN